MRSLPSEAVRCCSARTVHWARACNRTPRRLSYSLRSGYSPTTPRPRALRLTACRSPRPPLSKRLALSRCSTLSARWAAANAARSSLCGNGQTSSCGGSWAQVRTSCCSSHRSHPPAARRAQPSRRAREPSGRPELYPQNHLLYFLSFAPPVLFSSVSSPFTVIACTIHVLYPSEFALLLCTAISCRLTNHISHRSLRLGSQVRTRRATAARIRIHICGGERVGSSSHQRSRRRRVRRCRHRRAF